MAKLQKSINFFVGKLSLFFSLVKRYDMYILGELIFSRTNSRRSIISGSLATACGISGVSLFGKKDTHT